MPRKDVIFERMQGTPWYSCMDLLSGYYQFRMRDSDTKYTAFQTPDGLFEHLVILMGLSNAPLRSIVVFVKYCAICKIFVSHTLTTYMCLHEAKTSQIISRH